MAFVRKSGSRTYRHRGENCSKPLGALSANQIGPSRQRVLQVQKSWLNLLVDTPVHLDDNPVHAAICRQVIDNGKVLGSIVRYPPPFRRRKIALPPLDFHSALPM